MSDVQDVGEVSSTTDISQVPSGEIVESVTHTLQNEAIAEAVNSITGQPDAAGRATGLEEVTLQDGSAILAQPDQEATSSQRDHVILTTQEQGHEGTIPVADNTTLQSLLAANSAGTAQLATANGETIQIITVSNPSDLAALTTAGGGKLWQVLPAMTNQEIATIIAVNQSEVSTTSGADGQDADGDQDGQEVQSSDVVLPMNALPDTVTGILLPQPAQNLPPGCPSWATRLKDCERIGDSYRGWVESEVELDLLLTYHKQQTQSFWGTRQSPSPAKASTRLMWKSQYVPFDGMPFVNAGSRAIVMECQFGPRRKGAQIKRQGDHLVKGPYKQTCPARIYIKKVRKFPEFAVDTSLDKKTLKIAMDKSFQELKMRGIKEGWGQERYYVQLPSEEAHEFHVGNPEPTPAPASQQPETITITADIRDSSLPHRLHSQVANKIRELVAGGETRLYAIRKALRRFVMREMFDSVDKIPERHNLTYFPTVNDLQNHIHQAIRDIEKGVLPVTAPTVNVEVITSGDSQTSDSNDMHGVDQALWDQERPGEGPHAETVTVTLTQNPGEDGHHTISRVETHLSDGTTQVSDTLSPETAQLLSKLHPNMFPAGTLLQVQDPAQPNNQNQAIAMETTLTHSDQEDHSGLVIQDQSNLVIKQPDEMVVQLTDQTQTVLDQGQGQILLQQQGQGHIIVQQDPNQLLVQQDHALVMEGQVSEDMMDNNDGQAHALTSLQIVQADDVGQSVVQPHMITVAMAPETGEAVQLVKDNGLGP